MKPQYACCLIALTLLASAAVPQSSSAQHIYDKTRDGQAQAAKKLADDLSNGTVFAKEIENLKTLSSRDADRYFVDAKRDLHETIQSFDTWGDVEGVIKETEIRFRSSDPYSAEKEVGALIELKLQEAAAEKALDGLKEKVNSLGDRPTSAITANLGDLSGLDTLVTRFTKPTRSKKTKEDTPENRANLAALKDMTTDFKRLAGLYESYNKKLGTIREKEKEIQGLSIPLSQIALERLQIEEDYWKSLAAIRARRESDRDDLKYLVAQARNYYRGLGLEQPGKSETKVAETLSELAKSESKDKRDKLIQHYTLLFAATALAGRGATPDKLAELRRVEEEQLYSIRQSALMAHAYEVTIQTGVTRLALYHKGGVKPSEIAALIHTAATLATPAAILAR